MCVWSPSLLLLLLGFFIFVFTKAMRNVCVVSCVVSLPPPQMHYLFIKTIREMCVCVCVGVCVCGLPPSSSYSSCSDSSLFLQQNNKESHTTDPKQ